MTTFAQLKTRAAALMNDPSSQTFDDTNLGRFVNAGIAELSRVMPQRFVEDIQLVEDTVSYPVRGGDGNLVANPSFEQGDETMFDGSYNEVSPGDSELTGGWEPSTSNIRALWSRSVNRKTGLHIGTLRPAAAVASHYLYQDIPVNAGSSYAVSGWHWKSLAGGRANIVRFHTLDGSSMVVATDAVRHDTTAATPQAFSGTIDVPDDGTVAFIRVILLADTDSLNVANEVFAFEDIAVVEVGQGSLVAANAQDQIEVTDVELWSTAYDPEQQLARLTPHWESHVTHSEGGWRYWAKRLRVPRRYVVGRDVADEFLRVRGYAPYDPLTSDDQVTDLPFEGEYALMDFVQLKALEFLLFDRDLFTQWQARTGNTDITPAGLMNNVSLARENWRRTKRELLTLREG